MQRPAAVLLVAALAADAQPVLTSLLDRFHGDDAGGDGDDPETGSITTAASNCPCTVWGTKSP